MSSRLESLQERVRYGLGFEPRSKRDSLPGAQRLPGWVSVATASGLMAAALPPIGLGLLGFLAPAAFLLLCLPGHDRTNLRMVFWWGLVQWLLLFHFIRLPHWAGWLGWPLIAAYFSVYNVLLVSLTRRLIRHAGWSPILALPLVWVSLEFLRSTLLSGLPMGQLGHALYRFPFWIQTADIAGELTVSFLVAMVGSSLAMAFLAGSQSAQGSRLAFASLVSSLALMSGYGWVKFTEFETSEKAEPPVRVGLVQGAQDVRFGLSAEEHRAETLASLRTHQALTAKARAEGAQLVVWAESMFPVVDLLPFDEKKYHQRWEAESDEDGSPGASRATPGQLESLQRELPFQVREVTGTGPVGVYPYSTSVPLIVGMRSFEPLLDADYNAAVYFGSDAQVAGRYFKTHLVPFGEYLPLGDVFPWLYQFAPMARGLTPGNGVAIFEVEGRRLAPTICYESVMGRLLREYLTREIDGGGEPPQAGCDALLNISNDGWFWGSSALDLHLASNVFRAVENRTPHLVVCNTGISAEIAANGRIVQEAPKREATLLMVDLYPRKPNGAPWWWQIGNLPWWIAVLVVAIGVGYGSVRSVGSSGLVRKKTSE